MSIKIGPHSFSARDAERLLADAADLFDGLLARSTEPGCTDRIEAHRGAALDAVADEAAAAAEQLRAVWEGWQASAAALRVSGALGPSASGTVAHLAVSGGGVPKTSVERADVSWSGLVGDRQASRKYHGAPWQALCLWSTEVIEAFVAQGDSLAPGRAGDNVTVTGVPWDRVGPGSLLRIGEITCEVWEFATPCVKNRQWFHDRRFDRMHARHGPVSRVYAAVVEPGAIAVGDSAVLL